MATHLQTKFLQAMSSCTLSMPNRLSNQRAPYITNTCRIACGLGLSLIGLTNPGAAQTTVPASGQAPVPTSQKAEIRSVQIATETIPSASGGLLGQLGRELSAILLQNREGVVLIRGFRQMTFPQQNIVASKGPLAPGASAIIVIQTSAVPVIGSGFLVQGDIVVTTAEVAQDIINPMVILADNRSLRVLAKSLDSKNNIAIFKVEKPTSETDRHVLQLGDSDAVFPGELTVTIGNQAGFSTSGGLAFIAQTRQRARSGDRVYPNLIQFQGAISPGSSGSPLLSPTGEVIGMVMAAPDITQGSFRNGQFGGRDNRDSRSTPSSAPADKSSHGDPKPHTGRFHGDPTVMEGPGTDKLPGKGSKETKDVGTQSKGFPFPAAPQFSPMAGNPFGGLSNIGFALPINSVKAHLEELIGLAQPVPAPGWMGINLYTDSRQGVVVRNLYKGCAAETSGVTIGDIVLQVDGVAIHSERDFYMAMRLTVEGQKIKLQVQRGNELRTITVRMGVRPEPGAEEKMPRREPTKSA